MTKAHHYVLNLNPIEANLINNIKIFNLGEQTILSEISTNEAASTNIKVKFLLEKIRTYINLTRISELPHFELKCLDVFQQEAWSLFDDLKKLLKLAESL